MGFHFAATVLAAVLGFASALRIARAIAERLARDQFSPFGWALWLGFSLGGAFGLSRVTVPLLFALGSWLLGLVVLTGVAVEVRGGELRRKLALPQLYAAGLALAYALLRSSALLSGTKGSPKYAYGLHAVASEVTLPLFSPLGAPAVDKASAAVFWAAQGLSEQLFAVTALATFACSAFALAYLAVRPLPAPGADSLPLPGVASLLFLAALLAAVLLPVAGTPRIIASFVSVALLPFFVAEGAFAAQRFMRPLRIRLLLLALVLGLGLLFPVIVIALALLGVLANWLRLRELLPFNRLADTPFGRPPLGRAVGWLAGFATLFVLASLLHQRSLAKHTSSLSASADVCGGLETSVTWADSSVAFTGQAASFRIDVDERALPAQVVDPSSAASACQARGKRLCSIDEWYTACLCTYSGEAKDGMKLGTNHALVARAERERSSGNPKGSTSTLREGKQSEVRGLLGQRSEIVENPTGGAVLVAGPAESMAAPWTVDCRYRTLLTAQALAGEAREFVALRCCSSVDPAFETGR